jgi:hypothetical protein
MADSEQKNHWRSIAELLGTPLPAESPDEQPTNEPAAEKISPTPPPPARTKKVPPARPAPKSPANWGSIAEQLGMEPPPEPESKDETRPPFVETESAVDVRDTFTGQGDIESPAKPPRARSEEARDDWRRHRGEFEPEYELDLESPPEEKDNAYDAEEEPEAASHVEEAGEAEESLDESSREEGEPRRRRRRRRGRRGRKERPSAAEKSSEADDQQGDEEEEYEEEDEVEEVVRATSRSSRESSDDDDDVGDVGRPKHTKIPTWDQAIGFIIEANMAGRSRSHHHGSRGRGRGRGHRR